MGIPSCVRHHTNLRLLSLSFFSYVFFFCSTFSHTFRGRLVFSSSFFVELQSQTQGGRRYTPQLTRFYTGVGPVVLLDLIQDALTDLKVQWKAASEVSAAAYGGASGEKMLRMRIGGYDKRRLMFKGWVELEPFKWAGKDGSFCVMQRDQVSKPLRPSTRGEKGVQSVQASE